MGLAVAPAHWVSPRARLALMTVLLTACIQDHEGTVVAIVGTEEITAEELRHFVRRLAPSLISDEAGQRAREEYLQTLVDREIALLEAYEKGLDQDPDVLKTLDEKRREYLFSLYRGREILPRIQVSEEEIRQFFDQQDMARERRTTAILVRTREQAQQIRAQLEAGSDFGELARKHSLDTWSALREGELGFVSRAAAERLLGIPVEVFDTLG
ncbi:MAG: peptidylprolyl isomerase, partial [Gemmatimonadota bacterium]|nr:peptidylprolyl isomerase [Gemmatimonadota bacterium]